MEFASIIIAITSVVFSAITYCATVRFEKRKITIEAINMLQNEVLDKFVAVRKDNAKIIVENLENEKCREAYDDYRALIARLEHFAVGVNKNVYDFGIVNHLVGSHFVYLYRKIRPIIDEANKTEKQPRYYCNYRDLVKKLDKKQRILKEGEV